jgi:uncharacterized protein YjbI with pentapeptide repeats
MADPEQLALLTRSVEEWNTWHREALYKVMVNLSGANLSKADLSGAELSDGYMGANLCSTNFSGADLSKADLSGAKLIGADLSGANLSNALLWQADLSNADLSGANLGGAHLRCANLSSANLNEADLSSADLSGADLSGARLINAKLIGANLGYAYYHIFHPQRDVLRNAKLVGADLSGANLSGANLEGADFTNAKRDASPPKSTRPEPQPSQSSSTTNWLSLVETVGSNLLVTTAALAAIIQGLDVVERRWRERQAKYQQQGTPPALPSSSRTPVSDKEIIEILLVMDDGSHHTFKRWVSDPDALRAYIDAFSDPASKFKPLQVVFRKREGRALTVNVTESGKDNRQLNVILSYLKADPQP